MSDVPGPGSFLNLLNQTMAELSQRLRHFSCVQGEEVPLSICLPRLKVAARLLKWVGDTDSNQGVTVLGREVGHLIQEIEDLPNLDCSELEPVLESLAEALEDLFTRLDSGEQTPTIFEDPVWLTVISHLENAGSPLEVMDRLDKVAQDWESRWAGASLNGKQECDLQSRWLTFREYGDAMFGSPEAEGDFFGNGRQVVVLLEGQLRREQVQRKLLDLGFQVRVTHDLAGVETWIQENPSGCIVFCDNLEPSKHLLHLTRLTGGQNAGITFILVLGSRPDSGHSQLARSLGAHGVWSEPFTTNPLLGL